MLARYVFNNFFSYIAERPSFYLGQVLQSNVLFIYDRASKLCWSFIKTAAADHEEVTYAPAVASGSRIDVNGVDDDDNDLADLRSRRNMKRVAQVSRLSRELTKRKRRQEDWMDDSD